MNRPFYKHTYSELLSARSRSKAIYFRLKRSSLLNRQTNLSKAITKNLIIARTIDQELRFRNPNLLPVKQEGFRHLEELRFKTIMFHITKMLNHYDNR